MAESPRRPRKTAAKKAATRRPAKTTQPPALAEVTALPAAELEPPLLSVLNKAVAEMAWLKPTDETMVELCREYCRRIDETKKQAEDYADIAWRVREVTEGNENDFKALLARLAALEKAVDITKVAAWVGPHLANALRDIGGAPAERKGLESGGEVNNRLTKLRANASGRKAPRSR